MTSSLVRRSEFRIALTAAAALGGALTPRLAHADTGAPPPDAEALVAAPKDTAAAPEQEKKLDGTTATVSAGGMSATGNSRQLAMTGNGVVDTLFGSNGIGFSLLGNYGRSAAPGEPDKTTAENLQGRLRYDRYLIDRLSVFVINTGRHDRFQGLNFRYNLDPGVKYLFVREAATSLWGEFGYDFQYDIRRQDARIQLDSSGAPIVGAPLLPKTHDDHSLRAFAGFKQAFNEEVTLATGVEYLQSLVKSEGSRVNFDALFAAKIGGGLALGLGFNARYDHAPLPGKEKTDTATTVSLIYAFSNVVEPSKPPPAPCPEPAPAVPAPAAAPAPVPAPPSEPAAPPASPAGEAPAAGSAAPLPPAGATPPAPAAPAAEPQP
ncbi:MAG TPA: DUF481 domain-containing protein [Polyangiaceae bacterium]|jgi:putative salt-induced outer membrane protein YdiY